jgi:hypothetical protein
MKDCIVEASRKPGQYRLRQTLDCGFEVLGVCREQSVGEHDAFARRIQARAGAISAFGTR